MPRSGAGHRYPFATTAAREHNHRFCPTVAAIARNAQAGNETWGTRHEWHVTSEDDAKAAKAGFYAARYCRQIRDELGEAASVQSGYEPAGETFVTWVRVWPRSVAKAEIARRVKDGEPLAYNVLKGKT